MKDKILIFIIGLLVGAIITASVFLINEKINKNVNQIPNMERMQMLERPDGKILPEKPNDMQNNENRREKLLKNDSSANSKTN